MALIRIRDAKLYREQYKTFADYCEVQWKMPRQHAYRLMDAAQIVIRLESLSPRGDKILPQNEKQVRPMVSVMPEDQPKVWNAAQIATNIEISSPRGDKILPQNEFQLRPMVSVMPEDQPKVWDVAQIVINLENLSTGVDKILPQTEKACSTCFCLNKLFKNPLKSVKESLYGEFCSPDRIRSHQTENPDVASSRWDRSGADVF
jgi:hypothetical protein